jgi:hypothetical protein
LAYGRRSVYIIARSPVSYRRLITSIVTLTVTSACSAATLTFPTKGTTTMETLDLAYVRRGIHEELVAYIADQEGYFGDEGVRVALREGSPGTSSGCVVVRRSGWGGRCCPGSSTPSRGPG